MPEEFGDVPAPVRDAERRSPRNTAFQLLGSDPPPPDSQPHGTSKAGSQDGPAPEFPSALRSVRHKSDLLPHTAPAALEFPPARSRCSGFEDRPGPVLCALRSVFGGTSFQRRRDVLRWRKHNRGDPWTPKWRDHWGREPGAGPQLCFATTFPPPANALEPEGSGLDNFRSPVFPGFVLQTLSFELPARVLSNPASGHTGPGLNTFGPWFPSIAPGAPGPYSGCYRFVARPCRGFRGR